MNSNIVIEDLKESILFVKRLIFSLKKIKQAFSTAFKNQKNRPLDQLKISAL